MEESSPSIWKSVIGAYRDVFLALLDMPAIAVAAFVLSLVQAIASAMVQPDHPANITPAFFVYGAVVTLVFGFLMTPVLIAIHRFILLDDITRSYRITLNSRFLAFFRWAIVLAIFYVAVFGIGAILLQYNPTTWILVIGIVGIAIYLLLPLSLLFPAIAVDAPGANWRNAYSDASGHVGRLFAIMVLAILLGTLILLIIKTGVIASLWAAGFSLEELSSPLTDFSPAMIFYLVVAGIEATIYTTVPVAVVSRFYQRIGVRLAGRE